MPRRRRATEEAEAAAEEKRRADERKARGVIPALFRPEPLTELVFNVIDAEEAAAKEEAAAAAAEAKGRESRRRPKKAGRGRGAVRTGGKRPIGTKSLLGKHVAKNTLSDGSAAPPAATAAAATTASTVDGQRDNATLGDHANSENASQTAGKVASQPGRVRFAEHERPPSAAAGRTTPGPSVLKTPSRMKHARPKSASPGRRTPKLPAPTSNISEEEICGSLRRGRSSPR